MLILSINQVWSTRQLDLSNAFVQATLVEDVYLALPTYFESEIGEDRANMFMKIKNILYGLFKAPLYWYNHPKGAFQAVGFKPIPLDPYIFYGIGMISIVYVGDVLFFGPNQDNIDEVIKELLLFWSLV